MWLTVYKDASIANMEDHHLLAWGASVFGTFAEWKPSLDSSYEAFSICSKLLYLFSVILELLLKLSIFAATLKRSCPSASSAFKFKAPVLLHTQSIEIHLTTRCELSVVCLGSIWSRKKLSDKHPTFLKLFELKEVYLNFLERIWTNKTLSELKISLHTWA